MRERVAVTALLVVAFLAACGEGPGATGRRLVDETPTSGLAPATDPDAAVSAPAGPDGGQDAAPSFETPSPGQPDVTEVTVTAAEAAVGADGRLIVRPVWMSGPPPCHVLDHTTSRVTGDVVEVHVFEGGRRDTACPEIALARTTDVDVGPVPPGTYRLLVGPPTDGQPASVVRTLEIPAA